MDYFQGLRSQIRAYLVFVILAENILLIGGLWFAARYLNISLGYAAFGAYGVSIVMTFIITFAATDFAMEPLRVVWQAVAHIAPNEQSVAAPNVDKLVVGKVLVSNLTAQIYEIAAVAEHASGPKADAVDALKANFVANNLPLPLLILDEQQTIIFANDSACKYLGRDPGDVNGQNIFNIAPMSFGGGKSLRDWLEQVNTTVVTANNLWERVQLVQESGKTKKLFDMAAYFNKSNSNGYATLLVLFDHSARYGHEDEAVDYLALSVHELRAPLTMLRGYIEVFKEELDGKLTPELTDFMHKMEATAQQLNGFVSNILKVAKFENDQMVLTLSEASWPELLNKAVELMQLRARVRGITLECDIADGLPTVAVDPVSIQEVINNLIDNAIKYSGDGKKVRIKATLNKEGLVETTVQDWGPGIPAAAMSKLFTKFYRDPHKRTKVSGTGLGLYLCKVIMAAHGGNIWVRSKEDQGSIFGITLQPYAQLAQKGETSDNNGIIHRTTQGWIKNHSLNRR